MWPCPCVRVCVCACVRVCVCVPACVYGLRSVTHLGVSYSQDTQGDLWSIAWRVVVDRLVTVRTA
jgi:hypothetical protein